MASSGARDRSRTVLFVSAFAPELAPLVGWLEAPAQRRVHAHVSCQPVGIGAVEAAAGAAAVLSHRRPSVVVFIGTAGSYGAEPPLDAVAIGRTLHLVSASVVARRAYLPGPMPRVARANADVRRELLAAAGAAGAPADVATPLGITTSRAVAARLAQATGAAVENLEAFAVARAAARADVPFGALLGIANRVGPAAHEQWRRHQASATSAACAVATAWVTARFAP